MTKTKRNELCPCDSGKKYKKCCLITNEKEKYDRNESTNDIRIGKPLDTERLHRINQYLLDRYSIRAINVTDILSSMNVNLINKENRNRNIVVVAERKHTNETVFKQRGGPENDMLIMYNNNYLCFNYDSEWDEMITRLHELMK